MAWWSFMPAAGDDVGRDIAATAEVSPGPVSVVSSARPGLRGGFPRGLNIRFCRVEIVVLRWLLTEGGKPERQVMRSFTDLASVPGNSPDPFDGRLRLAVAAYLARFKGSSREHTESDLRCYLHWCAEHGLDLGDAKRPHLELYIRWMQEVRRFKPSTVSRRFSVTAGFYRTCVLDGILEHSPAGHVRRSAVPAESPTVGFTHLEFEGSADRRQAITKPARLCAGGHARAAGLEDL